LVIALGARFSDRATGDKNRFAKNFRLVHIDIDNAELDKNIPTNLSVQGDIKDALERLTAMVEEKKHQTWSARIAELRADEAQRIESARSGRELDPFAIVDIVSEYEKDSNIVTDVGQHQMWTAQRYPLKKPRTFLTSGGLGTMGFGMGAAIGAAEATGRRSILFTGDGSFGMNLNELATSVTQNTPLTIVIMNNGVLGMVRQWQTLFFDKHYSNTTLDGRKTDFVKLAEAFGAKGARVFTKDELRNAIQESFSYDGTFVIDCAVDSDEFVLPMLPPGGSIDDIITEIK
ncbi:MAG: thiamine pyrophosphate-binding protein, partial [Ruminococcus sp.]|nr:thiamine pyrophosphate-binding protein [Ruminococcus sp.]